MKFSKTWIGACALLLGTACADVVDETGHDVEVDGVSQAAASGAYGWAWVNVTGTGTFTPNTNYSHNSSGGAVNVITSQTGLYDVDFLGLEQIAATRGNAQVTAYGAGNARCWLQDWGPVQGRVKAIVRCKTPDGTAVNSAFVVSFFSPSSADEGGYVVNSSPRQTGTYTPAADRSWNSAGRTNTITRNAVGDWSVKLPGVFNVAEQGNAIVTSLGGTEGFYCKLHSLRNSGSDVVIGVGCFNNSGARVDQAFSLSYTAETVPSRYGWGAYALANNTTAAAYTPTTSLSYTASEGLAGITEAQARPQAGRSGTGDYFVTYPYMPYWKSTVAHSTALSSGSGYCKIVSWFQFGDGARVSTRCYNNAGTLTDSQYMTRYMYDNFVVF